MQRSAMRELAFKLVYEIEVQKESEEEQLDIFLENNDITDVKVVEYLKDIKEGIKNNADEINTLITSNLKDNWSLNRISKINLSLIKLAIYEIKLLILNLKYFFLYYHYLSIHKIHIIFHVPIDTSLYFMF